MIPILASYGLYVHEKSAMRDASDHLIGWKIRRTIRQDDSCECSAIRRMWFYHREKLYMRLRIERGHMQDRTSWKHARIVFIKGAFPWLFVDRESHQHERLFDLLTDKPAVFRRHKWWSPPLMTYKEFFSVRDITWEKCWELLSSRASG